MYKNKNGAVNTSHHSSEKMDWETPDAFFQKLDEEFHFTLDVCAGDHNHKCARYLTAEVNGLTKKWTNEVCWMNPPYGTAAGIWMRKARREALPHGATVVCFVPARTETRWFQETVFGLDLEKPGSFQASELRTVQGRVIFKGAKLNAPFSSVLIIFRPGQQEPPRLTTFEQPK